MLKLIDGILQQFRICFKREKTFGWFIVIIVRNAAKNRDEWNYKHLGLEPGCYEVLIHFFSSSVYDL